MHFDRELAARITQATDDRDKARFFAGRGDEIKAFKNALIQASDKPQAVFRIFQGAPGCGKTSLATHLCGSDEEHLLVVCPEEHELRTVPNPRDWVNRAADAHMSLGRKALSSFGRLASGYLTKGSYDKEVERVARKGVAEGMAVVIHIDEAHALPEAADPALKGLHVTGLSGVPCVVLLTGLEHTAQRIQNIPGLSRLPEQAKRRVNRLPEDECADSTLKMLDALSAWGDKDSTARKVAGMALEWPQHLHCAQQELVHELIEHDGHLDRVDWKVIGERTDARRERYYNDRLDYPIFKINPHITWKILRDVHGDPSCAHYHALVETIAARFEREGVERLYERMDADPIVMAKTLHEKGVLTEHGKAGWEIAVPSMADWIERKSEFFHRLRIGSPT